VATIHLFVVPTNPSTGECVAFDKEHPQDVITAFNRSEAITELLTAVRYQNIIAVTDVEPKR